MQLHRTFLPHALLGSLTILASACLDDPAVLDGADAAVEQPDAAREGVSHALPPGVCLPRTCGFIVGDPSGCGLVDDGCGGTMWCGSCACTSNAKACELDMPVIAEVTYFLGPSQTLTATTSGLSAGADSVLHILESSGSQLAMNDDRATGCDALAVLRAP